MKKIYFLEKKIAKVWAVTLNAFKVRFTKKQLQNNADLRENLM